MCVSLSCVPPDASHHWSKEKKRQDQKGKKEKQIFEHIFFFAATVMFLLFLCGRWKDIGDQEITVIVIIAFTVAAVSKMAAVRCIAWS